MSGSPFTFRGPTPLTDGLAANQCLLPWNRAKICDVCEPSKLLINLISSDFNVVPFTGVGGVVPLYGNTLQDNLDPHPVFSGARSGVTFEGPFLQYTITKTSMDRAHADGLDIGGMAGESIETSFYFDLVNGRAILLPYPGTVHVIGQYPGTWVFQTRLLRSPFARVVNTLDLPRPVPDHAVRHGMPLESDNTLSLRVAIGGGGNSGRVIDCVPPGAHSLTVAADDYGAGGVYPTVQVNQETNPKVGAAVGPTGDPLDTGVPLTMYGSTMAYMNRIGHHNAQGIKVMLNAATEGMIQWHTQFA